MFLNLFQTYLIGFLFFFPVLCFSFIILQSSYPYNRFEWLYYITVFNFSLSKYNRTILNTTRSLNYNVLANLNTIFARCKEIYLSHLSESNSNNLSHFNLHSCAASQRISSLCVSTNLACEKSYFSHYSSNL